MQCYCECKLAQRLWPISTKAAYMNYQQFYVQIYTQQNRVYIFTIDRQIDRQSSKFVDKKNNWNDSFSVVREQEKNNILKRKTYIRTYMQILIITAALFSLVKSQKQPRYSSSVEWANQLLYIHTSHAFEYYPCNLNDSLPSIFL